MARLCSSRNRTVSAAGPAGPSSRDLTGQARGSTRGRGIPAAHPCPGQQAPASETTARADRPFSPTGPSVEASLGACTASIAGHFLAETDHIAISVADLQLLHAIDP